ncbi:family 20 glycosylhydrolase [Actinomadura fibrosa]|uniref:beta-N-acetylhexosaminidase n=1 Tax=Actinomadura fibrosa TaxID=111802 RepID=A0ABW2XJZ7_9ACTN|nr:family 20 glycosylhydrolase [Actinomadura fibrosa]
MVPPSLIPFPAHLHPTAGVPPVAGTWHVRADAPLAALTEVVRELLRPHLGKRLVTEHGDSELRLTLGAVPAGTGTLGVPPSGEPADETYRLAVTEQGIVCRANSVEGAFRAATTAAQALAGGEDLACLEVADAPRYAWRGLMVDPARGFVTAAELRRLIDLAALYKLNALHLHLTDNEGWRIELPGLPQLTAGDSPFYTVRQYRDLQAYAAERFVTLIPEIDLPGHCKALRAAFPDLPAAAAPGAASQVRTLGEHVQFHPPLDLADPATAAIVERVLAEMCALTSGPYVHIGADEAMGMAEEDFSHAVRTLRALVREHGKHPLAWQESARAGVTSHDIAQYWFAPSMMSSTGASQSPSSVALDVSDDDMRAVREFFNRTAGDLDRIVTGGGRVLLSPQSHLYLDRPYVRTTAPTEQADLADRLGFPFYPPETLQELASWDPAVYGIPEAQVAGIEATLFGETVGGFDDLTTLLLPRLPAIAETAWSGSPPSWPEHRSRLADHASLWRDRGLRYFASEEIPWTSDTPAGRLPAGPR